jgi:hypothetical protein
VAVCAAGVILLLCAVFVALYFVRRRRQAAEDRNLSQIGSEHRDSMRRRTKMSLADRAEAEEQERSMIIRKSLAGRSSTFSTTSSRGSWAPLESARNSSILEEPMELAEHEDDYETAPRDDWKEWEARAYRDRANSDGLDPALQGHPALAQELHTLSIPRQSRTTSPPRMSSGAQIPLPTLPSSPPRKGDL